MADLASVLRRYGRPDPSAATRSAWRRLLSARDLAAIEALLEPAPGMSLLDAGCGGGHQARWLKRRGLEVWAVDLAPEAVALVRPFVDEARVADLGGLALGRTFNRVLCSGAIELVDDAAACIARLAAHLAATGRLVLVVPRPTVAGRAYAEWQRRRGLHVRLFEERELVAAARAVGLAPAGSRRPLPHDLVIAFTRVAIAVADGTPDAPRAAVGEQARGPARSMARSMSVPWRVL